MLTGPGQFVTTLPAAASSAPTITMPPAVKDHATLTRYSAAFKDYAKLVAPPSSSLPAIGAVDFPTTSVVATVRARANPDETVPARLASMLSLGAQSVAVSAGRLSNAFISPRLDLALAETLRFIIPILFDRVMYYPHLRFPLSRKLEAFAPEVFLPRCRRAAGTILISGG